MDINGASELKKSAEHETVPVQAGHNSAPAMNENPQKGYVQAVVLSSFFGSLGIDRFYLGKIGTGIIKLLTFGGLGLWYVVDAVVAIAGGSRQKGNDAPLVGTAIYKPFFAKVLLAWALLYVVILLATAAFWAMATPHIVSLAKKHQYCVTVNSARQCKTGQQWIDDYQNLQQKNPNVTQLLQNNPDITNTLQNNPSVQQYLRDHPGAAIAN